jgi:hypothetical protein
VTASEVRSGVSARPAGDLAVLPAEHAGLVARGRPNLLMNAIYQKRSSGNTARELRLCRGANGHGHGDATQVRQPDFLAIFSHTRHPPVISPRLLNGACVRSKSDELSLLTMRG